MSLPPFIIHLKTTNENCPFKIKRENLTVLIATVSTVLLLRIIATEGGFKIGISRNMYVTNYEISEHTA
jgi:hypothetical protein